MRQNNHEFLATFVLAAALSLPFLGCVTADKAEDSNNDSWASDYIDNFDSHGEGNTDSEGATEVYDDELDTSDTNSIIPDILPDPDETPPDSSKPVKVYILSGQSNMVGIGQVASGTERYTGYYVSREPGAAQGLTVSVYAGAYDPATNYDNLTPAKTEVAPFGSANGDWPTYSGARTDVARGYFEAPATGKYKFSPGWSESTYNVMELDGKEVYRRNVGEDISVNETVEVVAGQRYPVKITFFKTGHVAAWIRNVGVPGTLETVTREDGLFPHLIDDAGNWTVRNDVWYKGVVTATANKWLTVGCGAGDNSLGPELGFGHVMGYYHDEPVLLIKASQGNRSLAWDILPPGSERYIVDGVTYAGYGDKDLSWSEGEGPKEEGDWYAGKQYDDFVAAIHDVLDNFATLFPNWANQGYEIAGFAWFQGHKDQGNTVHAERYEHNLVNLIKAYRNEFNAPDAPFVIATIGFDGWQLSGDALKVANGQLAVSGETGNYPEFSGNVLTVETRDFWRDASISPKNQGYHYNQNAETYMLVGEALGKGMVELLEMD